MSSAIRNGGSTSQTRLFSMKVGSEKERYESELLKELDALGEETFAEVASERLQYYMEGKKVDEQTYYESRYKPLENDAANTEEAYAKMMIGAKVLEYGSNFSSKIFDPASVVESTEELIENILRRSVSKNINNIISRNQTQAAQQLQMMNMQTSVMPLPYSRVV